MINLAIAGAVATATLARPPVNAINDQWLERFTSVLATVESATGVSVLLIRSDGRVFSAGADLYFMRDCISSDAGRSRMIGFTRRLQQAYASLESSRVVSIAEIGGAAMGGGLELALACDLRVVAESAILGLPEARLGLLPAAGGTQRLTQLCGAGVARRLILGAETVSGVEAVALGLAHWSHPADQLMEAGIALAARIAALSGSATAACKHCIAAALDPRADGYAAELDASAALLAGADAQNRVHRFLKARS